jgi:hypothetical protein
MQVHPDASWALTRKKKLFFNWLQELATLPTSTPRLDELQSAVFSISTLFDPLASVNSDEEMEEDPFTDSPPQDEPAEAPESVAFLANTHTGPKDNEIEASAIKNKRRPAPDTPELEDEAEESTKTAEQELKKKGFVINDPKVILVLFLLLDSG